MELDIDIVRQHLKADGDDDELITMYMASALSICEGFCNRRFFASDAAMDAAVTQAADDYQAALTAHDAAVEAAGDDCVLLGSANDRWITAVGAYRAVMNGMVADATVIAAQLQLTGHLYKNRQEVIAGQGAAAVQVPVSAQRILQPYLWIGDLG